jgi:hypothetical protein
MEARANLSRNQSSIRVFVMFVAASLIALILGGAGGYLLRGTAVSAPATPAHVTAAPANQGGPDSDRTRVLPTSAPVVTEQPPSYDRAGGDIVAEPLRDPKGFAIPI